MTQADKLTIAQSHYRNYYVSAIAGTPPRHGIGEP